MIRFTILGQLYSMKNSRIYTGEGRKGGFVKHPKAQQFCQDFAKQCGPWAPVEPLWGDVCCQVVVHYPSRRQDLDCALVYDCLQANGFIANDRQVKVKLEFWAVDPDNPRVEIALWPMGEKPTIEMALV